jgi:hypothetical protein
VDRDRSETDGLAPAPRLSSGARAGLIVAINMIQLVALVVGTALGHEGLSHAAYLVPLLLLCTLPLLLADSFRSPYALLGLVTTMFYVNFGLLEATIAVSSPRAIGNQGGGLLTQSELVILAALVVEIAAYIFVVRRHERRGPPSRPAADWKPSTAIFVGLILWLVGTSATLFQFLTLQTDNSNMTADAGFQRIGLLNTSLLLIANYAQPVGLVIIGYWTLTSRNRLVLPVVATVLFVQAVTGFVTDIKTTVLIGPVIFLALSLFIRGRVSFTWVTAMLLTAALVFPVLTAHRAIVGELGLSRAQALPETVSLVLRSIAEAGARGSRVDDERSETFLERTFLKPSIDIIVEKAGVEVPFRHGETMEPLLYALIPRLIWDSKPGLNAAQQFNRTFHLSDDQDTYISPSFLGEMYWNFGWAGVLVGMALFGLTMGAVAATCDLSRGHTLTRVLVILVTLVILLVHFEGTLAVEVVVWVRSILMVMVLHLLFARRSPAEAPAPSGDRLTDNDATSRSPAPGIATPFPNLLR